MRSLPVFPSLARSRHRRIQRNLLPKLLDQRDSEELRCKCAMWLGYCFCARRSHFLRSLVESARCLEILPTFACVHVSKDHAIHWGRGIRLDLAQARTQPRVGPSLGHSAALVLGAQAPRTFCISNPLSNFQFIPIHFMAILKWHSLYSIAFEDFTENIANLIPTGLIANLCTY